MRSNQATAFSLVALRVIATAAMLWCVLPVHGAESQLAGRADVFWDDLFQNTSGWIGADGNYSIPLATNTTLWLFSDTFVGDVKGGKRVNARMIHNSVALQHGTNRPAFYHGQTREGQADSFISPAHGAAGGYFWLNHGVRTAQGLYFFALQVVSTEPKGPFGFKLVDGWLIHVSNPDALPAEWHITQTKVPFTRIAPKSSVIFGCALLAEGDYVYIFGTDSRAEAKKAGMPDALVVARVPMAKLAEFPEWRFFANGQWQRDSSRLTGLFPNVGSEFSVTRLGADGRYAAVYSEGLGGRILLRLASAPTGPWSGPKLIYECPEMTWPAKAFCYAARAHPELATATDELLITYAANAWDFWNLFSEPRLYWPRFVRCKVFDERP